VNPMTAKNDKGTEVWFPPPSPQLQLGEEAQCIDWQIAFETPVSQVQVEAVEQMLD
jgi:hypothetical protein